MKISFDPEKRARTLRERGLDFEDAASVIGLSTLTIEDDRHDYGEVRMITYGWLDARPVAVVWTDREDSRRIISMRHMHEEEVTHVGMGRS